jgi:uncharacterized delta-60 repeat protein
MYLPTPKILAAAITLACANTTYATPIDLDTSFSSDGQRMANYSNSSTTRASYFIDVAVTPDDKIIAVGHASVNASQYEGLIVKHLADGSIDNTFALNGVFRHNDLDDVRLNAVATQADGKILVAGNQRDSGVSYKLIVLRLNSDGTLDTKFADDGIYTVRYSNPASSPISRPTYGHLHGRDIAINSKGEILISASQYTGSTVGLTRYLGHIIKLNSQGELDTGFGYNGNNANNGDTRIVYSDYNNYSVDITKLTFDANDKMYVGGQWSKAGSGTPTTMFLQRIAADGKAVNQANPFGDPAYNRWALSNPASSAHTNTDKQILRSAVVLPGGDIIGAGCDKSLPNSPARMQRHTPTGSLVGNFGTNGVVSTGYDDVNDCFRDLNYHPTVGIVAVGVSGTNPFVTYTDKDTGIEADVNILAKTGYFDGVATLSTGQIVAVGNAENLGTGFRESFISVFEGSPLTTGATPTATSFITPFQSNVPLNTPRQSLQPHGITITPTGSLSANVIDGEIVINSAAAQAGAIALSDGDSVRLRNPGSSEPDTETVTKLVIDRGTGFSHNNKSWKPTDSISTFKATTVAADRTPNAFSLPNTGSATAVNSVSISGAATIAGINATVDVTISSGAAYSIKRAGEAVAEGYTQQAGTIRAGDEITVRHTNSSTYATATTSTLTVGGFSTTYTTTTEALDTVPDAFSLGTVANTLGTNVLAQASGIIYVSGINAPTPISITNGIYQINSAGYTSAPGTINVGDRVIVRFTTSNLPATAKTITLDIGGVTDSVTHTTIAADTTPDAFSFPVQTGAALSSAIISAPITVSGIDQSVQASITNGEMSWNGGSYSSNPITVQDGDTIHVRHTSSSTVSDNTDSVLTVGGVTGTFTSVTTSSTGPTPTTPTPTPTTPEPTPEPTPTNPTTDPVASSSSGSSGGSMNFLYLLAAGLFFDRKRKS